MTAANVTDEEAIIILPKTLANIPVLEIVSQTKQQAELPLIVGYHGWTNVKESILTEAVAFSRAGYRVILPDAHLHGQRRPVDYAYQYFPDVFTAIQQNVAEFPALIAAIHQAEIPFSSVSIFGRSMGGMTVSIMAVHYHAQLAGVAHFIGSPDPVALLDEFLAGSHAKIGARVSAPDEAQVAPIREFLAAGNLSEHPEAIAKLPYFAYHGAQDDWVDVRYNRVFAQTMQTRLPQAPFKYLEFAQEDHWVPFETMQAAIAFLQPRLE